MQEKQDAAPALRTANGEAYDIPVDGSLGLLALGYSGLMIWREKRAAVHKAQQMQPAKAVEP